MFRFTLRTIFVVALFGTPMWSAVKVSTWGAMPSGKPVKLYTLENGQLSIQLTEYGARVVNVEAPDRKGNRAHIVLGYDNLAQYLQDTKTYFGAIVGRYGNRIAGGRFTLEGSTYQVPPNNNGNALHGGPDGFNSRVWQGRQAGPDAVEFSLLSPDGDMGFPGALTVHVTYTLSGKRLRIDYRATTTKPTVINLTNHAYFNLAGEGSGDILNQKLRIPAAGITPVNATLIPTGIIAAVKGTPFDFNAATPIGERIGAKDQQLEYAGGYDHNFVLSGQSPLHEAAYVSDPASGRTLTVLTTQPGVQFYSGNFLDGSLHGPSGKPYEKHAGFCLETQHFPDSPNHANFPSTELKPGSEYRSQTVWIFGVDTLR